MNVCYPKFAQIVHNRNARKFIVACHAGISRRQGASQTALGTRLEFHGYEFGYTKTGVMFKFDLSGGAGGGFKLAAIDLDLDPDVLGEVEVDIVLSHIGGKRHLRIQVRAMATVECDRTLRPFNLPVDGVHELVLIAPGEESGAEQGIDCIRVPPGQDIVDLTVVVRDTLLLAIPTRKVAPEADGLALQTVFGAPPTQPDWRWEALRQL